MDAVSDAVSDAVTDTATDTATDAPTDANAAQVGINLPLRLALESTGLAGTSPVQGTADRGNAEVILRIDNGGPTALGVWAQVQGPCSAQLLGGLVGAGFYLDSSANVWPDRTDGPNRAGEPNAQQVNVLVHLGLGLHLAVGWLLDIDIEADWTWATRLARGP